MKKRTRFALYILEAVLVVPTFYLIFNMGNPNSIFRHIIPDPSYDLALTLGFAICMAGIGLILSFRGGRKNSIENILDNNQEQIRHLRSQGKTDETIATDFLNNLRIKNSGVLYNMARRRVLRYLSKMD